MNARETRGGIGAVSGAFVFLLLGTFALLSTLMVLLSAQMYRATVRQTDAHNAQRLPGSYLLNAVHGADRAGGVEVFRLGDRDVLILNDLSDDEGYQTQLYCYDGYLCERYADAQEPFEPEYGEPVCALAGFEPALQGNLLRLRLTDAVGGERTLHVRLRCQPGGEEAGE